MRSSSRQQRQRRARRGICADAAWESTAVSLLFESQMSYVTVCMHCDHQTRSTQTFTVLSLPVPAEPVRCTVQVTLPAAGPLGCCLVSGVLPRSLCSAQDCLSLFFQQTLLAGGEQMLCSACGLRRETAVFTSLDKPPEILALHLKRYHQHSRIAQTAFMTPPSQTSRGFWGFFLQTRAFLLFF